MSENSRNRNKGRGIASIVDSEIIMYAEFPIVFANLGASISGA
jgi:hypothetical protein